ncbi:MAG: type II toxin-antitoxin system YoeB family toxin [Pseudonocardiaceae bacterium]
MKISVTGWEDYIIWSNERTILKRINRMIKAARDPAPGIGTPERLSHSLSASGLGVSVELLTAYSHTVPAADLRLCHTVALTSPVCPETEAKRP